MSETLPDTMTSIEISEPGGPEVLKPGMRPLPSLRTGEVLIKVAAAGINRAETMQRQGNYPVPDGATDILGLEAAGTVVIETVDILDPQKAQLALLGKPELTMFTDGSTLQSLLDKGAEDISMEEIVRMHEMAEANRKKHELDMNDTTFPDYVGADALRDSVVIANPPKPNFDVLKGQERITPRALIGATLVVVGVGIIGVTNS